MTKDQLVTAITSINRSAAIDFLMSFDVRDLRQYLEHLELTREPRGRTLHWRRADGNSAISMG